MTTRLLIPLLLLAGLAFEAWAADRLYRYRNSEGVLVIDFQIPPEYSTRGYEIISPRGTLLETVPPQQPAEAEPEEPSVAEDEARRREDSYILRSFSSVDDVEAARKRRLGALNYEMTALRAKQVQLDERRQLLEEKAASYQAAGKPVPDTVTNEMQALELQTRNTQSVLAERQAQYRETDARHDHYRQRLKELKGSAADSVAGSPLSAPATDRPSSPSGSD